METKKLITGFLILSAIMSSSVFLFSGFIGNNGVAQGEKNTAVSANGKVPANVFVEQLPATKESNTAVSDDGLPPVSDSSNLTDRLAQTIARDVVATNPNGPTQDQNGQLSINSPDINTTMEKAFATANGKTLLWETAVSDADVNIIKNYTSADLQNYAASMHQILNSNFSNPKITELLQNKDSSADAINAISLSVDQTNIALRKLSVPEQFLGFHKSLLTLVAYQKNALGTLTSDDPVKGALEMQLEEKNYDLAITKVRNEATKLKSITWNSLPKGSAQSFFADVFGIQTAHAILGIGDVVFDPITETETTLTAANVIWGFVKSIALQVIKNQLINRIMAQTLNWINGGGTPQFITNWRGFLGQTANDAAGIAIQNIVPGLCRSFAPQIQIQLNRRFLAEPTVTCTLDQVVSNVKAFYDNFAYGGWIGYGAMILPSGNYFGQLFESSEQIAESQAKAQEAAQNNAQAGRGFISQSVCVTPGPSKRQTCIEEMKQKAIDIQHETGVLQDFTPYCLNLSDKPDTGTGCEEKKDVTPGEAIAATLDSSLGANVHLIVNANDIIGIVATFVDSMINRLVLAGVNGLLGVIIPKDSGRGPDPGDIITTPTVPPAPSVSEPSAPGLFPGGAPPLEPSSSSPAEFHLTCQSSSCVSIPGAGADESGCTSAGQACF